MKMIAAIDRRKEKWIIVWKCADWKSREKRLPEAQEGRPQASSSRSALPFSPLPSPC